MKSCFALWCFIIVFFSYQSFLFANDQYVNWEHKPKSVIIMDLDDTLNIKFDFDFVENINDTSTWLYYKVGFEEKTFEKLFFKWADSGTDTMYHKSFYEFNRELIISIPFNTLWENSIKTGMHNVNFYCKLYEDSNYKKYKYTIPFKFKLLIRPYITTKHRQKIGDSDAIEIETLTINDKYITELNYKPIDFPGKPDSKPVDSLSVVPVNGLVLDTAYNYYLNVYKTKDINKNLKSDSINIKYFPINNCFPSPNLLKPLSKESGEIRLQWSSYTKDVLNDIEYYELKRKSVDANGNVLGAPAIFKVSQNEASSWVESDDSLQVIFIDTATQDNEHYCYSVRAKSLSGDYTAYSDSLSSNADTKRPYTPSVIWDDKKLEKVPYRFKKVDSDTFKYFQSAVDDSIHFTLEYDYEMSSQVEFIDFIRCSWRLFRNNQFEKSGITQFQPVKWINESNWFTFDFPLVDIADLQNNDQVMFSFQLSDWSDNKSDWSSTGYIDYPDKYIETLLLYFDLDKPRANVESNVLELSDDSQQLHFKILASSLVDTLSGIQFVKLVPSWDTTKFEIDSTIKDSRNFYPFVSSSDSNNFTNNFFLTLSDNVDNIREIDCLFPCFRGPILQKESIAKISNQIPVHVFHDSLINVKQIKLNFFNESLGFKREKVIKIKPEQCSIDTVVNLPVNPDSLTQDSTIYCQAQCIYRHQIMGLDSSVMSNRINFIVDVEPPEITKFVATNLRQDGSQNVDGNIYINATIKSDKDPCTVKLYRNSMLLDSVCALIDSSNYTYTDSVTETLSVFEDYTYKLEVTDVVGNQIIVKDSTYCNRAPKFKSITYNPEQKECEIRWSPPAKLGSNTREDEIYYWLDIKGDSTDFFKEIFGKTTYTYEITKTESLFFKLKACPRVDSKRDTSHWSASALLTKYIDVDRPLISTFKARNLRSDCSNPDGNIYLDATVSDTSTFRLKLNRHPVIEDADSVLLNSSFVSLYQESITDSACNKLVTFQDYVYTLEATDLPFRNKSVQMDTVMCNRAPIIQKVEQVDEKLKVTYLPLNPIKDGVKIGYQTLLYKDSIPDYCELNHLPVDTSHSETFISLLSNDTSVNTIIDATRNYYIVARGYNRDSLQCVTSWSRIDSSHTDKEAPEFTFNIPDSLFRERNINFEYFATEKPDEHAKGIASIDLLITELGNSSFSQKVPVFEDTTDTCIKDIHGSAVVSLEDGTYRFQAIISDKVVNVDTTTFESSIYVYTTPLKIDSVISENCQQEKVGKKIYFYTNQTSDNITYKYSPNFDSLGIELDSSIVKLNGIVVCKNRQEDIDLKLATRAGINDTLKIKIWFRNEGDSLDGEFVVEKEAPQIKSVAVMAKEHSKDFKKVTERDGLQWVHSKFIQFGVKTHDDNKVHRVVIRDFNTREVYIDDSTLHYMNVDKTYDDTLKYDNKENFIETLIYDMAGNVTSSVDSFFYRPAEDMDEIIYGFPNPFDPEVENIRICVKNPNYDELLIYDAVGNYVNMLDQSDKISEHDFTWDGRNQRGQIVANGGYICVLKDNSQYYFKIAVIRH